MKLKDFKILSFDTYGTLIDWETGIHAVLAPLIARVDPAPSRDEVLEAFGRAEHHHETESPGLLYSALLGNVYLTLPKEWGVAATDEEAAAFGRSIKDWPPFPDTVAALQYLKRHYKLVTLTNCDRASYAATAARLGDPWDAVDTAEEIGSYKPDKRNFEYLLAHIKADFGRGKGDLLHVAQSLKHDHVPATEMGLAKAWIDRRHGMSGQGAAAPPEGHYELDFTFRSLAELVEAHKREAV